MYVLIVTDSTTDDMVQAGSSEKPEIPRRMSPPFFLFTPASFAHIFYVPLRRRHLRFSSCSFSPNFCQLRFVY